MTTEEKQLLLRDLCARLPYGVKIYSDIGGDNTLLGIYGDRVFTTCEEPDKHNDYPLDCVKPYLRPMSTMTKEEKEEVRRRFCYEWEESIMELYYSIEIRDVDCFIDWLNAHHFDYRGLIEKGLAIEATEDMYKIE